MRSRLLGLLAASLVWALHPAPRALSQHPNLIMGSWNIKLLGHNKSSQDPKDLAKYINFAKVDILALQEISPTADAPQGFVAPFRTSKLLNQTCAALNALQPGANWKHILFPAHFVEPDGTEKQWTGIAWNEAKVTPQGVPFKIPVPNTPFKTANEVEDLFKRNAHAMKFSAGNKKSDFILIPLHLKSNAGNGNFRPHREAEVSSLIAKLPEVEKKFPAEKDIIILGDMNFLKDTAKLTEAARDKLIAAGFKDLNATDAETHLGGAPFDRFFVPSNQPEFKASSQKTLTNFLKLENLTEKQFTARFSDHAMIVMEVAITDDDD